MNKGFTLVELLAVVVLISVIASITALSIDSSLKKHRDKLSDIQIEKIETAAESYYLNEGIHSLDYSRDFAKYCVSTQYLIENDYIKDDEIKNLNYSKKINGSVKIIYDSNEYSYEYQEKSCSNKDMGIVCEGVKEETKTTGNVPQGQYKPGDEYMCEVMDGTKYRFFVLSTQNELGEIITEATKDREIYSVNLIMYSNINSDGTLISEKDLGIVKWINETDYLSSGGNQNDWNESKNLTIYGPITAMNFLQEATMNWSNVNAIVVDTFTDNGGSTHNMKTYNTYARMPYYSEIADYNGNNSYLYDYLSPAKNENDEFIQTTSIYGIYAYWTLSTSSSVQSSAIHCGGKKVFYDANADGEEQKNGRGVRPVINIDKRYISN